MIDPVAPPTRLVIRRAGIAASWRIRVLTPLLAIVWLVTGSEVAGATFIVNSTLDGADAAPGDGVCASFAGSCTLRAAVQEANTLSGAHVIQLPSGTYVLTIPGSGEEFAATGDLDIAPNKDVTIAGAGSSTTIVDANGLDRAFGGSLASLHLSDLTVQNGQVLDAEGGCIAIYLPYGGQLVLARVVIRACRAARSGGGIAVSGIGGPPQVPTVVVSDSVITGNAGGEGGGLFIAQDMIVAITRSRIVANEGLTGGGLFITGGDDLGFDLSHLTIAQSVISQNRAAVTGGGIDVRHNASVAMTDSTVSVNSARYGGGINVLADWWGGATVTIRGSTIAQNVADGTEGGGAFYLRSLHYPDFAASLDAANTTLSGNRTPSGGGGGLVAAAGAIVTLRSVTVTQNVSATGGALEGLPASFRIGNSIVVENASANCQFAHAITNLGHNLEFPGVACGFDLATDRRADPLLGPLADNGGPTQTHALSGASAAVDAGDDAACSAEPVSNRDQRGYVRPGGARCDIGAYERASTLAFTDDPLVARTTVVKAVHISELRARIDTQRIRFGLTPFQWADGGLTGTLVRAAHIQELRDVLRLTYQAATAAGLTLTSPPYTDDPLAPRQTFVRAVHIEQLRNAVRALELAGH